jgi:hypothetical protein
MSHFGRAGCALLFLCATALWADTVMLKDGTELEGTVLEETASGVTLLLSNGHTRVILKSNVDLVQIDRSKPRPNAAAAVAKPANVEEPKVAPVIPQPPFLQPNCAVRPGILLVQDGPPAGGGTASLVRVDPRLPPILITCLHIFGPKGGLAKDVPSADLDKVVREVAFSDLRYEKVLGRARGSVINTGNLEKLGNDIAAFTVAENTGATVLALATDDAKEGEWVWIVGDEATSANVQQRLFPAQVMGPPDEVGFLALRPAKAFETNGFSGAPIVNGKSEVVGVYNGRLDIRPDGSYAGFYCIGAKALRAHLEKSKK